jgi:hypothetical protein
MTLSVREELTKEWKRVGTQTMLIGDALQLPIGALTEQQMKTWTSLIAMVDRERGALIVKTHECLIGATK